MILRREVRLSTEDLDDIDEPQLHGYLNATSRHLDDMAKLQAFHIIEMLGKAMKA